MQSPPDPSPDSAARIDQVCDRFEAAWRTGGQPQIEQQLTEVPADQKMDLLRELLAAELELRAQAGDEARLDEYLARFPDSAEIVREAFGTTPTVRHAPSPVAATTPGPWRVPWAMQVRCPHCHNPIELIESDSLREIKCPSCDSLFSLVDSDAQQAEVVRKIIGHFELLERLGTGGFGTVWKARDTKLDRIVALKIPRRSQLDADELEKFFREARAAAQLKHPNIVSVHEVGRDGEIVYIVSDYVEGRPLDKWLEGQKPTPREAATLCEKIARALHHAHEAGVVHRDLKPSNIILDGSGEPHVMDFGLAKREAGEITMTVDGQILGTPAYMSPEQARGEGHKADRRTDIYSLGVLLYQLLTGELPFRGSLRMLLAQVLEDEPPSPRRLDSAIPRDLETVSLKCLEKSPSRRYDTAVDVADELSCFLSGEPIQARPITSWERGLKWARRRPAVAMLIFVSILTLATSSAGGLVYAKYANQRANLLERDLRDRQGLETKREEVQHLIARGRESLGANSLQESRVRLSAALAKIGTEIRLADEKARAERLMAEVEVGLNLQVSRQTARDQLQRFKQCRDQALFYGSQFTGLDPEASCRATRTAAKEGLAVIGMTNLQERPVLLESRFLSDSEKMDLQIGCYELLLTLAEAAAKPVSAAESSSGQAGQALLILDRAESLLGKPTCAAHLQRAKYLAQQDHAAESAAERQKGEARGLSTAVDFFLTGKLLMSGPRSERTELATAIGRFESALRMDPDHFWAQYFIALCQLRSQRPDLAKAHLTACVGRRPDFVWIYIVKGLVHGELKEFEAAEADFRKAQELHPDENAQYIILVNRGVMWFRKDELTKAVTDLENATRLKPLEFQAHVNLAQVYQKQKHYPEAEVCYANAMRIQPKLAALYRSRGAMRLEQRQLAAALQDFEESLRYDDDPQARLEGYTQQGRILHYQHQTKAALAAYDAALAISPNNAPAHLLRAQLLLEQKQHQAALASLDAYLRKGRATADIYLMRSMARAALGDYPGAIDDCSRALERNPDSATYALRGWVYTVSDASRVALRDFEEAVKLDPNNGDAYNGRGFALVRLGMVDRATRDAEEALRLGPQTPRNLYNTSRIYAQAAERLRIESFVNRRNDESIKRVPKYEGRALQLLRQSLEVQSAQQRQQFWQDYIRGDACLKSLHRHADFAALEKANGK